MAKNTEQNCVGIYIPTYNRAESLSTSIQSAIDQTYRNIYIYIYDNNSTDNTSQVCSKFSDDSRVHYVKNKTNIGSKNFHKLFFSTKEKWFMFLADDDWIDSDYIEKCLSYALSMKCVSVSGAVINYKNGTQYNTERPYFLCNNNNLLRLFNFINIPNSNAIFYGIHDRSCFYLPYRPKVIGDDWTVTYNQVLKGRVAVIKTTHIHREFTKWSEDHIEKTLSIIYYNAGFNDYRKNKYNIYIIESMTKLYELCEKNNYRFQNKYFLFMHFSSAWAKYYKNTERPYMINFIDKILSIDNIKENFSYLRYCKMRNCIEPDCWSYSYMNIRLLFKSFSISLDVYSILWNILFFFSFIFYGKPSSQTKLFSFFLYQFKKWLK